VIERDNGLELEGYFISGNANWFRSFDFNCKEISNSTLTTSWTYANYDTRKSETSGIVFPIVDYIYNGLKFGSTFEVNFRYASSVYTGTIFPCLYIHTLVTELSKIAGIKISGTLMDDILYKSIVITPDGPELTDPRNETGTTWGDQETWNPIRYGNSVAAYCIAPDMKAIEIIKWLTFTFGCSATFDEYSQTLSIDVIDKIKKEDAQDWSEYFVSYEAEYDKVNEKNFIRQATNSFETIKNYDFQNEEGYGGANLSTDKNNGSTSELYKSPFYASYDQQGSTALSWASPYVGFFVLEDEDIGTSFSSVTNQGGLAQFDGAGFTFDDESVGYFIRIEGSTNYDGIHQIRAGYTPSAIAVVSNQAYIATDTGVIYTQKATKVKGHRILVNIPNLSTSSFTSSASLVFDGVGSYSSLATAYFHKPTYTYSALNAFKLGMSYGTITDYNDQALEETHYKFIHNMLKNPTGRAYFLLPESVFQSFEFGFIYIKTKMVTGYFYVQKIDNYLNALTPVRVDLLQID